MKELIQINLKDAVDKKIIKVSTDYDYIAIRYSDDTFSYWEKYNDWEMDYNMSDVKITLENLIEQYSKYGTFSDRLDAMIELDLISLSEFLELPEIKKQEEERKNKIYKQELEQFEILKKKLGK